MLKQLFGSFIFFVIIIFACSSPEQKSSYPVELENSYTNKSVVIKGVVNQFDTSYNHLFIKTKVYNLLSNHFDIESEPIFYNGNYSIEFTLDRPQEFELLFADHAITLFAQPGDNLTINLDFKSFLKKDLPIEALDIPDNGINQLMWSHFLEKKSSIQVDSLSDAIVSNWLNNKKKYKDAEQWIMKDSLLSGTAVDYYEASANKNYYQFLCNYENYLIKHFRRNNKHLRHAKDTLVLKSELNHILRKTTGYASDVLLSRYFYLENERITKPDFKPYINFYLDKIKSKSLKTVVQNQIRNTADFGNTIESNTLIEQNQNKDLFRLIKDLHKGKVIYIDFWATWCVPCIKEMSIYKQLKQDLDEDDVAFVYLAINSPEKMWKKMSVTLGLQGFNHLMTQEEYDKIDRLFYVETIPHYALIDKKGNIAMDMAPHPSKGNGVKVNDKLIKKIHQLLVQ